MTDTTISSLVETKKTIINRVNEKQLTIKEACTLLKMSRVGLWKLRRSYRQYGLLGLTGRKRGPKSYHRVWNRTVIELELKVVSLYESYGVGPDRLVWLLSDQGVVLSRSTIYRILVRRKMIIPRLKRKRLPARLYAKGYPGEEVQLDATEPYGKRGLYLLTAIDDYSRTGFAVLTTKLNSRVAAVFLKEIAFRAPFVIRAVRVDNGPEFKKEFVKEAQRLGIRLIRNPPHHPQSNGKVERLHRTIEEECLWRVGPNPTLTEASYWLSRYLGWYNERRRHGGFGMNKLTPKQKLEYYLKTTPSYQDVSVNLNVILYTS